MDKISPYIDACIDVFLKIIFPALAGVTIKLAVMRKRESITLLQVVLSYIIGIGVAWLCSPFIKSHVSESFHSIIIAVVAISGDKIAEFVIYKWDVDLLLQSLAAASKNLLLNIFFPKRDER